MIVYHHGSKIYQTLFRVHGSALYKSLVPAVLSTGLLIAMELLADDPSHEIDERWFNHPYPIAAMIAAFTFLLTFKCSFSYNRYWEACTSIHQMHAKWLDVGIELAAWHLQSERYDDVRPPTFGSHPELDAVVRRREQKKTMTPQKLKVILDNSLDSSSNGVLDMNMDSSESASLTNVKEDGEKPSLWKKLSNRRRRKKNKFGDENQSSSIKSINPRSSVKSLSGNAFRTHHSITNNSGTENTPCNRRGRLSQIVSLTDLQGGMENDESPSLFLQEASHLLSLLSAVAFATLRNDVERAPSPLTAYEPGSPWPSVDPDADGSNYYESSRIMVGFNYLLGRIRTDSQRTVYNYCRPLKVLGGVSDAEIKLLQRARGPAAKTAMCSLWLQEFISREFQHGALGKTAPPIVSRLYQFVSDGTLGYHQARKVAYVPFPFAHAQLTTFYVVIVTFYLPVLMLTFVTDKVAAAVINFFTVGVFVGLWQVSNELEDPFRNVPNDLPLNFFQAEFNEALIVMFAGYHPEAWWDIGDKKAHITSLSELTSVEEEELRTPRRPQTVIDDNIGE